MRQSSRTNPIWHTEEDEETLKRGVNEEGRLREAYFEWMTNLVCNGLPDSTLEESYEKLFRLLDTIEFTYTMERDENRAYDGRDLRYRFGIDAHIPASEIENNLDTTPCSIFEMMVALANRCEEHIMDNTDVGNRTSKWFFEMIRSLGLIDMYNENYDESYILSVINRFLNHGYDRDGRGGLFTVKNCATDMRRLEIWYQLMRYLNTQTR